MGKSKTVTVDLSFEPMAENAFPVVGWHPPYGTFTTRPGGPEWEISIASGVRSIVLRRPDGARFTIAIQDVVEPLIEAIEAEPKPGRVEKRKSS